MDTPDFISLIGTLLSFILALCFVYRIVYFLIGLFGRSPVQNTTHQCRYGVLISARNEEAVISDLIHSIQGQDYPSDLVTIFVIADNCTDHTASAARNAGAHVYERFNRVKIGKGYALNELLQHIEEDFSLSSFDGFFVFDADNIPEPNYITEMNRIFNQGYRVVTSYRNSKNFGSNWISSGYAISFLREARYLNKARMLTHNSCLISGTGFLVHSDILQDNKGWKHHLLTEDIEFSADMILQGETIGYCEDAILYDEQPTDLKTSWNQRMRWSKGFYQVFYHYGWSLLKKTVKNHHFSCYDMFMTLIPGIALSFIGLFFSILPVLLAISDQDAAAYMIDFDLYTIFVGGISGYLSLAFFALVTVLTEWKRIHCQAYKKILAIFTYPLFMATYIPIGVIALVKKVEWTPIPHTCRMDVTAIGQGKEQKNPTSLIR